MTVQIDPWLIAKPRTNPSRASKIITAQPSMLCRQGPTHRRHALWFYPLPSRCDSLPVRTWETAIKSNDGPHPPHRAQDYAYLLHTQPGKTLTTAAIDCY